MKAFWILVLIGFGLYLVVLAWPVSIWLIAAFVAYVIGHQARNPWAKSLASIAEPSCIGLSVVFLLILAYHWIPGADDPANITWIEKFFIGLDRWVVHWLKPSPFVFACILAGLLLLARFLPDRELVGKSLGVQKRLSKPIAVVTLVSNFTFFSAGSLIEPVDGKLEARYRSAAERKNKAVGQSLALEATRRALVQASPSQLSGLRSIATAIASYKGVEPRWKEGGIHHWTSADIPDPMGGGIALPPEPIPDRIGRATAFERYHAANAGEEAAAKAERAVSEAEQAVRKVASDLLAAGEKSVSDGAWLYVESYVDRFAPGMGEYVRKYGERMTGTLREKLVTTASDQIAAAWKKRAGSGAASTAQSLKAEFRTAMSEAALRESLLETAKAKDAVARVNSASRAGNAEEAERWAKTATSAADDAVEASKFARSAGGLDAAAGALHMARTGDAAAAVLAAETLAAANAARVAAQSAEAAQAARAAAAAARAAEEAMVAARAARAAESAATAAKALKAVRVLVP